MATKTTKKKTTTTKAPAAAAKTAATKVEETKTEAKAAEVKTEAAAVEAEVKEAPAAKAEEKAPAKKETKAPAKKPAAPKKAEAVEEVFVEFEGNQIFTGEIVDRIKDSYVKEGHYLSSIKTLRVYINLGERRAYYVINDKAEERYVEF